MNYQSPQLLDELAAQYAIGTLRGPARVRFERLCKDQPAAESALRRWEDKLVGLMAEVKPVEPPRIVWQKIQERLGHGERTERVGFFAKLFGGVWTKAQLAAAASVVAIALTLGIVTYVTTEQTVPMATFANEWGVETVRSGSKLVISRLPIAAALDQSKDYELWALPDSGAAPVSLGIMPKSGKRELVLTDAQRAALAGASKIAVSLEALGGSTTGAPGTVLHVTDVTRA